MIRHRVSVHSPLLPATAQQPSNRAAQRGWGFLVTARGGLLTLVAVTPWFFGGVDPTVQIALFASVLAVLVIGWVGQAMSSRETSRLPSAVACLALAIGLAGLQLIALPGSIGSTIAPRNTKLWSTLGEDDFGQSTTSDVALDDELSLSNSEGHHPISLFPASTRRDLSLLILATSVFVAGVLFFRASVAQMALCVVLAITGGALAFFGIAQQLAWNGQLYWRYSIESASPFASFINKNNGAGYLNLCLSGAIGLLVWTLANKNQPRPSENETAAHERRGIDPPGVVIHLLRGLAEVSATKLVAFGLCVLICAGIFCSLSRGAFVAMAGGGAITWLVASFSRRGTSRTWLAAVAMILVLILVGWIGRADAVQTRLATLLNQQQTTPDGRWDHWADGWRAAGDYWIIGSGLGTYRFVYRLHEQGFNNTWFYHAENQYLEALVEGGAIGLAIMLSMIVLVGLASLRLARVQPTSKTYAFGICGIYALTSQAIHAGFDFGLYLPANMMTFALICGAVTGGAASLIARNAQTTPSHPSFLSHFDRFLVLPKMRTVPATVVTLLACAMVASILEARSYARIQAVIKSAPTASELENASADNVRRSVRQLQVALAARIDDARGQEALAGLLIGLYRLSMRDQWQQAGEVNADSKQLWRA
ncbi:MAG: O-antigen ligase family protein, partial [Pirellulales bacterium]|nr:O-antigen ligase family protein [Pirellulales bacterium]